LDLAPEPPTLLKEIFDFYRRDLRYSMSDMAVLLAARPEDLGEWYPASLATQEPKRQFRIVN
jgi:hypothetical protein